MTVFPVISVIVTFAAIGSYLNRKYLHLPATIGNMAFALIVSLLGIALQELGLIDLSSVTAIVSEIDFSAVLLHGMLSFLLFAGALHINLEDLKNVRGAVALLSTLGLVVATGVTGSLMWLAAGFVGLDIPYLYCLLFGALISPTDPVAVLAILKETGISKSLYAKIGGEGLFNDGVGVVVFLTILGIASGQQEPAVGPILALTAQQAGGGLAVGFLLGWITYLLLRSIDDYKVEVLLTLALVMGGYVLAEFLDISAPICMVAAGLVIGNQGRARGMSPDTRARLDVFWELVDDILNTVLFMLIGLEILVITMTGEHIMLGVLAIGAALGGRLIGVSLPVLMLSSSKKFEGATIPILTWGGLHGGISIAMALSLPMGPERNIILPVTYIVVLFSILVQGLTFRRVVSRFATEA